MNQVFAVPGKPPTKGQEVALDAFTFRILDSGGYTYIAKAKPGVRTTDNSWKVFRVDDVSSPNTVVFADGDSNYDNQADDMTNLTYA